MSETTTTAAGDGPRFGRRLKELRKKKGWLQSDLGQKCGVHWQQISSWERSDLGPTARSLLKLATALGCTPNDLLVGPETDGKTRKPRKQKISS